MIQAIKNGNTKTFSDEVWRLLGANKNGWEQVSDSVAENNVKSKPMPNTGELEKGKVTTQTVENTIKKETADLTVKNDVNKVEDPLVDNIIDVKTKEEITKADFFKVISENLTKNVIKNFLDSDTVNLPYKANDNMNDLSETLFTHFNGDIAALKSNFQID